MKQDKKPDIAEQSYLSVSPQYETGDNKHLPPFVVSEAGKLFAQKSFKHADNTRNGHLLIYTVSGHGKLVYRNNEYKLTDNSACVINCDEYHEYSVSSEAEAPWVFYWVRFSGDGCPFYVTALDQKGFKLLIGENNMSFISCFDTIFESLKHNDLYHLCLQSHAVEQLLTQLIEIQTSYEAEVKQKSEYTEKIEVITDFIKQNYWQQLTVDSLAKSAGLSKYHFIRVFKQLCGSTPYQYLTDYRILIAQKHLRTTDLKVFEVSIMVGFKDECHFYRTFKRATGMTPLQYRNL